MKWLQSGMRRDLCFILHGAGELREQALKTRLAEHYDERVPPRQFYSAMEALASTGHVTKREDGLHDVYALTDGGERALRAHLDWLAETTDLG